MNPADAISALFDLDADHGNQLRENLSHLQLVAFEAGLILEGYTNSWNIERLLLRDPQLRPGCLAALFHEPVADVIGEIRMKEGRIYLEGSAQHTKQLASLAFEIEKATGEEVVLEDYYLLPKSIKFYAD
jgi:hypothetical protein